MYQAIHVVQVHVIATQSRGIHRGVCVETMCVLCQWQASCPMGQVGGCSDCPCCLTHIPLPGGKESHTLSLYCETSFHCLTVRHPKA